MATTIYALCDPDLQIPVIRYIGKTLNLKRRTKAHQSASIKKKNRLGCWLKSLAARGESPVVLVLTEVPDDMGSAAEILYIRLAREGGMDLVNGTDGGDGGIPTLETRKIMSAAMTGVPKIPQSLAHRISLGAVNRGRKRIGSSSKYIGVWWNKRRQKWQTAMRILDKRFPIGCFDLEIGAAKAFDEAALRLLGPDAKLNFPVSRCGD